MIEQDYSFDIFEAVEDPFDLCLISTFTEIWYRFDQLSH